MPLTPKQARFVDEYMIDLNATQAAIRAGYSAKSAKVTASRMLTNANVQAEIASRQSRLSNRASVTAERVIQEFARIAFTDRRSIVQWGAAGGVTFTPSSELTDDQAACVEEVSQTITDAGGTLRVRMASKIDALDRLGKHLGLFIDKLEIGEMVKAKIVEEIVE